MNWKRSGIALLGGVAAGLFALQPMCVAQAVNQTTKLERARKDIRHIVVLFQENESFDHYFGTYPHALNPPGEPKFTALPGTPKVDGYTPALLHHNRNFLNPKNGKGRSNPFRLDRSQAATADQTHDYMAEQQAYDHGKMDLFPLSVGQPDGPRVPGKHPGVLATSGLTMGYFDGNTVTALWNYAQHFAMSDHQFDTVFGPSTPGAIDLVSGQTNGVVNDENAKGDMVPDGNGGYTLINDPEPLYDICSDPSSGLVHMTGRNIGNLLTAANVSWGWFEGGFDLTRVNPNGSTGCRRNHLSTVTNVRSRDYAPHHEPFQYYKSTANPKHILPSSPEVVGTNHDGGANHQYDTHEFFAAIRAGNFPTVSFIKAPAYEDGHAGYSDPLDEQRWLVRVINFLERQPQWKHTAVIIAWDDSDGWYDHVMAPITNGSETASDALDGRGKCGDGATALGGVDPATKHAQGRCAPGPRLPLLIISPWAKSNYVDHTETIQASIIHLIENLYLNGERIGGGSFDANAGSLLGMFDFSKSTPQNTQKIFLNPNTGLVETAKEIGK